ncbi:MAG: hypothetical protein GOMPHAMPRED_003578 [Gomphillus americanus]|uniref:Uncharacterized protein n=1 Tax=Gomphillus americanus TaxID=1940652 RepID=A0A8H3IMB9_9LECA|nr:MAG: hypothetical protein GOMPHAMPRED_003578 [Gomphillus americanus]
MDAAEARAYINGSTAYSTPVRRPRGPLIICGVAAFIFFSIFFSTSSVQQVSTIAKDAAYSLPRPHMPAFPEFPNLFRPTVHQPPPQKNSSSGTTKWYSDWKWLNPFSSSVTLDETRVVLPPLKDRPHIYTYYDAPKNRTKEVVEEEKQILSLWRRAWWAQGFTPIILGSTEAMQNPHYETLQMRKLDDKVKNELMRWLAWGYMGEGILTNWLLLPMAPRNDADLSFLRRGNYGTKLLRYETMDNSIYAAMTKDMINEAISTVLANPKLDKQASLQDAIPDSHAFDIQVQPTGFALYNIHTIRNSYKTIATGLETNEAEGLKSLQRLMTSHLHGTFLEQFPAGIAVLNLENLRTTMLVSHSVQLANILNKCSNSPIPGSCPPNRPSCRSCKTGNISYTSTISNDTKSFTIGVIPHPYTYALLERAPSEIDVPWVRRTSERDPWITRITDNIAKGLSAYGRIITFKNLIANDETRHASIWHTVERDWNWKDLEWHFGFALPVPEAESGSKAKIQPAPEALTLIEMTTESDPPQFAELLRTLGSNRPTSRVLADQVSLIKKSGEILTQEKFKGPVDMRGVIEAWNLADTEAWRFVNAFAVREHVQQERWEREEKRFFGGEGVQ